MFPVLRKVAQLNIMYRKKWGPIIDICTGTPPDEVTALNKGKLFLHIVSFGQPKNYTRGLPLTLEFINS